VAIRCENEVEWMEGESAAIAELGRRVAGAAVDPVLAEALAHYDASPDGAPSDAYEQASEVLSCVAEAVCRADLSELRAEVEALRGRGCPWPAGARSPAPGSFAGRWRAAPGRPSTAPAPS